MAATATHGTHCRKATELVEVRELRALRLGERLGLWMHLRICAACRIYHLQSRMIDRWLERRAIENAPMQSDTLETRIIDAIPPGS